MNIEIKYASVLGSKFDTAKAAIEDEKRLPSIIATYEKDLEKMERTGFFCLHPVTEEYKGEWRKSIARYKALWEEAQASHRRIHRIDSRFDDSHENSSA